MLRIHAHVRQQTFFKIETGSLQRRNFADNANFLIDKNHIGSTISVTRRLRESNGMFHIQSDSTCWKSASSLLLNLNGSLHKVPNEFKNKKNMMALTANEWTKYLNICGFQKAKYPKSIQELSSLCYHQGPLISIIDQDKFLTGESSNIFHLINIVGTVNGKPIIVENETQFFPLKEFRDTTTKYCHVLKDFDTLRGLLTSPDPIEMPWEVYIDIPIPCRPLAVIDNKITTNPPRNKPVTVYPGIHSLFYLPGLKDKIDIQAEKLTHADLKKIQNDFLSEAFNYPRR